MLVAHDKNHNRIYADSETKYKECYCPICGELLTHKKGKHKRPYFSHKQDTTCLYEVDKDSKCEWHIRMQELFPKEAIEVRFNDKNTGELRFIADVYLKESNTVIEFQHSRINDADFFARTMFHIQEGRRIVWVFDERKDGSEYGRLKKIEPDVFSRDPWYNDSRYKWSPSRIVLNSIKNDFGQDQEGNYSICLYLNDDDNTFRRVIYHDWDYKEITLSLHSIKAEVEINLDEFFLPEDYWKSQSPWKEMIYDYNKSRPHRIVKEQTLPPSIHKPSRFRL